MELNELLINYYKSDPYETLETKDLAGALAKAQGEYPVISCNRVNPFFKSNFADLDYIMRQIRPILSKNGLCITQQTKISPEGFATLHSKLRHASGQWIESRVKIVPPKNDAQSFASTMTYHKRHAALALLGLTVSGDMADDDAEGTMERHDGRSPSTNMDNKVGFITSDQVKELEYELADRPDLLGKVLTGFGIKYLTEVPQDKYRYALTRIRELKNLK